MTASPHVREIAVRTSTLLVMALVLTLGTVVLPELVSTALAKRSGLNLDVLPARVRVGFDTWSNTGMAHPTPALSDAVHFWRDFHVVKALLSALLLAPLVVLQSRAKVARAQTLSGRGRLAFAAVESAALLLIALSVVLVVANIQGAVAPLSSVLSFLPTGAPTSGMDEFRNQLTHGNPSPAAMTLTSDFRIYHAVVAACSALICGALLHRTAVTWQRSGSGKRSGAQMSPTRAQWALIPAMLIAGLITAANVSTVVEPTPALVSFLSGAA